MHSKNPAELADVKFSLKDEKSQKILFLLIAALLTVWGVFGIFIGDIATLPAGLVKIVLSPCALITDYIEFAGPAAAFVNSALVLGFLLAGIALFKVPITGAVVAGCFISAGFAMFGKNIFNTLPIYLGIFIYTKLVHKKPAENFTACMFATSLCPLVSEVPKILAEYGPAVGYTAAVLVGTWVGFIIVPLARWTAHTHLGYNLYNYGFATGLASTVIVSVINSFGYKVESNLIWSRDYTRPIAGLLITMFFSLVLLGIVIDPKGWRKSLGCIVKHSGRSADFFKLYGLSGTFVNMGLVGLLGTFAILAVGGDLNGPTAGCIVTIAGFGAIGLTVRNVGYLMGGVWIASYVKTWSLTDPPMQLCILLSSGLAPIAGEFGLIAGLAAGFLHSSVARNVGGLSSPLNLYNNGFAIGMLAIFLVPIIKEMRRTPLHIPDSN